LVMLALPQSRKEWTTRERKLSATALADAAVNALIQEAELTPKPGLVDSRGPGIHKDMNLAMLRESALALRGTFLDSIELAYSAVSRKDLRAGLGVIGRAGEQTMLLATGGINTHRGAIWTLGLLCAGVAILGDEAGCAATVCAQAGGIAQLPDPVAPRLVSHGWLVRCRYGSRGARGEAEDGFPHLIGVALPILHQSRREGATEDQARLNALVALMAVLEDTCLLHRAGTAGLTAAQSGARKVLDCGGVTTPSGRRALMDLDCSLLRLGISPGGSADLLAGALLLDWIDKEFQPFRGDEIGNFGF
jgi:triphosphoribosyl-dephospho-CoA synthase